MTHIRISRAIGAVAEAASIAAFVAVLLIWADVLRAGT
jgi:hypothetical protein